MRSSKGFSLTKSKNTPKFFLFTVALLLFLLLNSCAEIENDLASNEIQSGFQLSMLDTVLISIKDSTYRHFRSSNALSNLFLGKYRDINASFLIEFTNFDSLVFDTTAFDSFRVDSASIRLFLPRNTGLYADQVNLPIVLKVAEPTIQWTENNVTYDTIQSNTTLFPREFEINTDTTNVNEKVFPLTNELHQVIQNWVSNSKQIRTADNNGLWFTSDSFATYCILSFFGNEAIDSLKPTLVVHLSKMLHGVPIGNSFQFQTKANKATTFIRSSMQLQNDLMIGAGDALRGIVWFDFSSLNSRNINIHSVKLKLKKSEVIQNFGNTLAVNLYYPANDSIDWLSEPTLYPANIQSSPMDSVIVIEASYPFLRWIRQNKPIGAFVVTDASENFLLNRTTIFNSSSVNPPSLHVTYSSLKGTDE